MKKYSDLEYLKLSKWERFKYRFVSFFASIPVAIWHAILGIGGWFKKAGLAIANEVKDIVMTFVNGDWKTKLSYLVMGFGNIARGQVLRGLLFLLFEVVFIGYMVLYGVYWMSMLPSLGFIGPHKEYHELLDTYVTVYGDNSFKILLYGVLTMFFIVGGLGGLLLAAEGGDEQQRGEQQNEYAFGHGLSPFTVRSYIIVYPQPAGLSSWTLFIRPDLCYK